MFSILSRLSLQLINEIRSRVERKSLHSENQGYNVTKHSLVLVLKEPFDCTEQIALTAVFRVRKKERLPSHHLVCCFLFKLI